MATLQFTRHPPSVIEYVKEYQKYSGLEYEIIKPYFGNPNKILEIGCGIGRMSIYINSQLDYEPKFILLDGTGHQPRYGYSEININKFYNNMKMTGEFCRLNGLTNFMLFDINKHKLSELSEVDMVTSFLAVGVHFPIEHYLDELMNITTDDCVFIFGIRTNSVYDVHTFENYFKDIIIVQNNKEVENFLIMRGKQKK